MLSAIIPLFDQKFINEILWVRGIQLLFMLFNSLANECLVLPYEEKYNFNSRYRISKLRRIEPFLVLFERTLRIDEAAEDRVTTG